MGVTNLKEDRACVGYHV